MKKPSIILLVLLLMLFCLPVAGVSLWGLPLRRYLEFPPRSQFVAHAQFSWYAFIIYLLLILLIVFPFILRGLSARRNDGKKLNHRVAFPWWGWAGLLSGIIFWIIAWTRFNCFQRLQPHTFTPLWVSLIITVNAICYRRTGRSLLTHQTRFFLILFPCSAAFWWCFEFLNRFVQNWHYSGVSYDALHYFVFASISFSTVLPAVLSVQQLILSFSGVGRGFKEWVGFKAVTKRLTGVLGLIVSAAALFFIGIFPDMLFSMLWIAPLITVVSLQVLAGEEHVLSGIASGDWRVPVSAALGALICGWFWEMWNYLSLAKWHYSVPLVNRFHIFEMPILGYAGYLPFGLECAAVGDLIRRLMGSPASLFLGFEESP